MTHYSKYKDYIIRKQLKNKNKKIFILKFLLQNTRESKNFRFKIALKLQEIYNKNFQTKIKNRCIQTTKVRSVSRLSNLTKASFKSSMNFGKLNGFKKSS